MADYAAYELSSPAPPVLIQLDAVARRVTMQGVPANTIH
jgi:hypothetical protein